MSFGYVDMNGEEYAGMSGNEYVSLPVRGGSTPEPGGVWTEAQVTQLLANVATLMDEMQAVKAAIAAIAGTLTPATGGGYETLATSTNVTDAQAAIIDYGDTAWITATIPTDYAKPGDAMTLTSTAVDTIQYGLATAANVTASQTAIITHGDTNWTGGGSGGDSVWTATQRDAVITNTAAVAAKLPDNSQAIAGVDDVQTTVNTETVEVTQETVEVTTQTVDMTGVLAEIAKITGTLTPATGGGYETLATEAFLDSLELNLTLTAAERAAIAAATLTTNFDTLTGTVPKRSLITFLKMLGQFRQPSPTAVSTLKADGSTVENTFTLTRDANGNVTEMK